MNDFHVRIKQVCETRLGTQVSDAEVLEMALWFRQLADLARSWAGNEGLIERLKQLESEEVK